MHISYIDNTKSALQLSKRIIFILKLHRNLNKLYIYHFWGDYSTYKGDFGKSWYRCYSVETSKRTDKLFYKEHLKSHNYMIKLSFTLNTNLLSPWYRILLIMATKNTEKKVSTVMVSNSIYINKMNNHLSSQVIEQS